MLEEDGLCKQQINLNHKNLSEKDNRTKRVYRNVIGFD